MGKIGDLFVRLGLKTDDFEAGIEKSKGSLSSLSGAFTFVKLAALTVWKEVAKSLGDIASSIMHSTQVLEDAWGRTMTQMKAGWNVFSSAVANMDFTNLFSNLREAYRLADRLYDAADAVGEINTSYNIGYAKQRENIAALKETLRNMGLSDSERLAAGNQLLDIFAGLEGNKTRGYSGVRDATIDQYMGKMGVRTKGLSESELATLRGQYEDFFVWLGSEQGSWANSAAQDVAKDMTQYGAHYWTAGRNKGITDQYLQWAIQYNKNIGDKDREAIEKSITDYYGQQARFAEETLRIKTQMHSIEARDGGVSGTPAAAQEVKTLSEAFDEFFDQSYDDWDKWEKEGIQVVLDNMQDDITSALSESLTAFDDFFDASYAAWEEWQSNDLGNLLDLIQTDITDSLSGESLGDLDMAEMLDSAIDGVTDATQDLFDALAGVEDLDSGALFKALLDPMLDTAKQMGAVLIKMGVGMQAAKMSIKNPVAAIVAGGALVAIAAAGQAALASIASGGSATTSTGTSYDSGNAVASSELTVYVKGTIKGSDIILSGQNTMNEWSK